MTSGQGQAHVTWIPGKRFKFLGLLGLAEIAPSCLRHQPAASLLSLPQPGQGSLASAPPQLFLALAGWWLWLSLKAMGTPGNAVPAPPYTPEVTLQLVMLEDFP